MHAVFRFWSLTTPYFIMATKYVYFTNKANQYFIVTQLINTLAKVDANLYNSLNNERFKLILISLDRELNLLQNKMKIKNLGDSQEKLW